MFVAPVDRPGEALLCLISPGKLFGMPEAYVIAVNMLNKFSFDENFFFLPEIR